jgi:amino acid permease
MAYYITVDFWEFSNKLLIGNLTTTSLVKDFKQESELIIIKLKLESSHF